MLITEAQINAIPKLMDPNNYNVCIAIYSKMTGGAGSTMINEFTVNGAKASTVAPAIYGTDYTCLLPDVRSITFEAKRAGTFLVNIL